MNTIIMSIHPTHVKKILDGSKLYEYRTRICKKNINKILIYCTTPIKKIVAEVEVITTFALEPQKLWNQTCNKSGISKVFFDKYFANRKIAYAYQIGKVTRFDKHIPISEYGFKYPPQSFYYCN